MFNGLRRYILPLALLYFISPLDLLPFMPLDDFVVAGLALATYFMTTNRSPLGQSTRGQSARGKWQGEKGYHDDEDDVITTSWSVVDDKPEEK